MHQKLARCPECGHQEVFALPERTHNDLRTLRGAYKRLWICTIIVVAMIVIAASILV